MRNTVTLLAAAFVVCACAAPAQIASNKARDYDKQPQRLFVMTDIGSEWGNQYYNAFKAKTIALLSECGAAVEMSRINGLELDEGVHLRRARAFKSDAVLNIRMKSGTKNQSGMYIAVDYDARMTDVEAKKVVWRSSTHFTRGLTGFAERGEQLAIDVTNKMKQDGIFRSCAVVTQP